MSVKPHLKIVGMATIFVLCGCATVLDEDGALAIAPYKIQASGRIVVEARVNGQGPFAFALDTGASISAIFDKLRNELQLEPIPGQVVLIHGTVASGRFPLLAVRSVEVGREVWAENRFASLPGDSVINTGIDGILGVDFLRQYAVGFSTRDRVVRLYPPELVGGRSYRGWATVPLEPEYIGKNGAALYLVETQLGSHRIPAIFDLGAGLNMINPAAAESIGFATIRSRDENMVVGAVEDTPVLAWIRVDEVTTGNISWRNELFAVAELEILATLTHDDAPCAILGSGLFNQRDFIIDFVRNRLLIKVAMDEVDVVHPTDVESLTQYHRDAADNSLPLPLDGQFEQPCDSSPVSCGC